MIKLIQKEEVSAMRSIVELAKELIELADDVQEEEDK